MDEHGWRPRLSEADIATMVPLLLAAGHPRHGAVLVHDLQRIRSNFQAIRAAFPERCLHTIAVKANPLIALLRALVEQGAGLEAASIEEVHIALAAGCPAAKIIYDGPAKTHAELEEALALGVRINADNAEELARIAALRVRAPLSSSLVGLRINPAVGDGTIRDTSVGGVTSRFGVLAEPERIAAILRAFVFVEGLHVHVGSQGCPLRLLVDAAAVVDRLLYDLEPWRPAFVDIGGGLPAWYDSEAPPPPSPRDYVESLRREAPGLLSSEAELVTEFGRAPLAGCGFALSRVEYVKQIHDKQVAVIGLGADLLVRAAYRPDVWRHEVLLFGPDGAPREGEHRDTMIAGPLCFSGDVVARSRLAPIRPGDLIAVRDTGAYTLGLWSRHCSRAMPLALGLDAGRVVVLRERESIQDVVNQWR